MMMAKLALLSAALLSATTVTSALQVIDATSSSTAEQVDSSGGLGLPTPPTFAELAMAQTEPETLQGFDSLLLTQINVLFGSENLPIANGTAPEPGMYLTLTSDQVLVFDQKIIDLQGSVVPPGPASRECQSGCKASLWSPLRRFWLQALEESQTYSLSMPSRVLFGAEASVEARTLIEVAYAAAETRPAQPPSMHLLVNGNNSGLRARPFYLLPPGGLRVSPGENALALRVTLTANETWRLSAAHPRFSPSVEGMGWQELAKQLLVIKKKYPNKGAIVIDVGDDVTVGDVVNAMIASQKPFPVAVLTAGGPVKWG